MSNEQHPIGFPSWQPYQIWTLQFFSIFFLLLIFPLDPSFYRYLFSGDWLDFHMTDLLRIVGYLPSFFQEAASEQYLGLAGFYSWAVIAALSVAGIFLWKYLEEKGYQKLQDYDRIYYTLRIILRYKLGFILIAYGSIKVYALQYPFPSLSNLYTHYGDFLPWKIWAHTIGIAPNYEAFLGAAEILAGLLLFSSRTVTFGAALTLGIHTNVIFSSFSYQMGNQVLATFVFFVALFLFAHDIPRIFSLLYLEKTTEAESYSLRIPETIYIPLKALAYLFGFAIFLAAVFNMERDPYLIPKTPGLKDAYGFYNVKEFILNQDTLPYTRTNPDRWQNVVFEPWATVSIKTAEPVQLDSSLYLSEELRDIDRVYESAGVGDRRYFNYTIDSAKQELHLQNKNAHYPQDRYTLHVERPDDHTILLEGVNEKNEPVKVVLERADRKFLLIESRRYPIEL